MPLFSEGPMRDTHKLYREPAWTVRVDCKSGFSLVLPILVHTSLQLQTNSPGVCILKGPSPLQSRCSSLRCPLPLLWAKVSITLSPQSTPISFLAVPCAPLPALRLTSAVWADGAHQKPSKRQIRRGFLDLVCLYAVPSQPLGTYCVLSPG